MERIKRTLMEVSPISSLSSMSASEFVDNALSQDACVVFSKSYCPFCTKVKKLLNSLNASFKVYELDNMDNGSEIQKELGKRTGATSVPRVFIGKESIGGCDDTLAAHSDGKLSAKLASAGAIKN